MNENGPHIPADKQEDMRATHQPPEGAGDLSISGFL